MIVKLEPRFDDQLAHVMSDVWRSSHPWGLSHVVCFITISFWNLTTSWQLCVEHGWLLSGQGRETVGQWRALLSQTRSGFVSSNWGGVNSQNNPNTWCHNQAFCTRLVPPGPSKTTNASCTQKLAKFRNVCKKLQNQRTWLNRKVWFDWSSGYARHKNARLHKLWRVPRTWW